MVLFLGALLSYAHIRAHWFGEYDLPYVDAAAVEHAVAGAG